MEDEIQALSKNHQLGVQAQTKFGWIDNSIHARLIAKGFH